MANSWLDGGAEVLHWRTDETLFSWCSRYHDLSLNLHDWVTGWQLFGHRRQGRAHDLPSHIDTWVDRTRGRLGDARSVVLEHTLLPYFLAWRPAAQGEAAITAMRGDSIGSLKFTLGLLTGRFGAAHPLKVCPHCLDEDRQASGRAHWHLRHQWPGVWWCQDHGAHLLQLVADGPGPRPRCWCLPHDDALRPGLMQDGPRATALDPALEGRIAHLAALTMSAAGAPIGSLADPQRLAGAYRMQMVRLGWLTRPDRITWGALWPRLRNQWQPMVALPELQTWSGEASWHAQAARLLYARGGYTHPLRHLLMIEALFPDWSSFVDGVENVPPQDALIAPQVLQPEDSGPAAAPVAVRSPEVPTSETSPVSARALARALHISVHTAQARGAQQGLVFERRPLLLRAEERGRARVWLLKGCPVAEVAEELQVSLSSVYRILQTDPALDWAWRQARLGAQRDQRRALWLSVFQQWPSLTILLARRLEPACYQWLYRHDRAWLRDTSRALAAAGERGNRVEGRWRVVDEHLARQVEVVALALSEREALALPALLDGLPALRRRLGRLHVLPRTVAVMERLFR